MEVQKNSLKQIGLLLNKVVRFYFSKLIRPCIQWLPDYHIK